MKILSSGVKAGLACLGFRVNHSGSRLFHQWYLLYDFLWFSFGKGMVTVYYSISLHDDDVPQSIDQFE
jgi:hypothetical protein